MRARSLADRLERPLVWTIAAVFSVACLSVLWIRSEDPGARLHRADVAAEESASPSVAPPPSAGEPVPSATGAAAAAPEAGPTGDPEARGSSLVPTAGVHRYEVQTTASDGTTSVEEEVREIEVLSGDRNRGSVRLTVRLGDESQVSVVDWAPTGAVVRTTRIDSSVGRGGECSWEPPLPEFGVLDPGVGWELGSTCQAPMGGVATNFAVSGTGSVVGSTALTVGGRKIRVWELRRDRTTTIRAEVGGIVREQTAREVGTLYLDPARGVVVRSDVTVTLGGTDTGVSRRVSVLQPA